MCGSHRCLYSTGTRVKSQGKWDSHWNLLSCRCGLHCQTLLSHRANVQIKVLQYFWRTGAVGKRDLQPLYSYPLIFFFPGLILESLWWLRVWKVWNLPGLGGFAWSLNSVTQRHEEDALCTDQSDKCTVDFACLLPERNALGQDALEFYLDRHRTSSVHIC